VDPPDQRGGSLVAKHLPGEIPLLPPAARHASPWPASHTAFLSSDTFTSAQRREPVSDL